METEHALERRVVVVCVECGRSVGSDTLAPKLLIELTGFESNGRGLVCPACGSWHAPDGPPGAA